MSARRAPARSRRVDDALSQLVDSLLPSISPSALGDDFSGDEEDAVAAAEEQRLQEHLVRAWRILDVVGTEKEQAGIDGSGGSAAENINNASDLIKRKLLRENASPDKAVRFSNLYSRLLTQPVLGQKWAILYLLYRLSEQEGGDDNGEEDAITNEGGRSRSPLLDDGNLDNLLFKSRAGMRGALVDDVDEGPAISSSVSQRGETIDRMRSVRATTSEKQRRGHQATTEEARDTSSGRPRGTSTPRAVPQVTTSQTENQESTPTKTAESSLLRDLPFILQGLSSTNMEFSSSTMLKLPTNLPIPMVSLLHTLAEPCLLYKELSGFVDSSEGGLVSQALRASIFNELRSYLGLVATLEGEIRRALTAAASDDPKGMVKGAVTLKRCVVWTRDATMALRLMSIMVEEARGGL
jgi:gamma-tubulin complex component 3